ncbi:hypothetical protein CBOM_08108 [Ceraceosorus bombacis]|uniref:Uncharacterized protein n=1 Tax=Ceraceosorus bombacis TaxID=401625 RepID=A0A0P1BL06_9BASI|nr:hypothetical protein CBOM_08108 [Ceraceosorus bombacis]
MAPLCSRAHSTSVRFAPRLFLSWTSSSPPFLYPPRGRLHALSKHQRFPCSIKREGAKSHRNHHTPPHPIKVEVAIRDALLSSSPFGANQRICLCIATPPPRSRSTRVPLRNLECSEGINFLEKTKQTKKKDISVTTLCHVAHGTPSRVHG